MKKRRFIKNKFAVSAPLEFTIAFGVLLIGIFFLHFSVSSLFGVYDAPEPNLRAKAMDICESLISSPGFPSDWETEADPLASIERLGLAKNEEDSYGSLSQAKIDYLKFDLDDADYPVIKAALGLTNTKYSVYNFNFTITRIQTGSNIISYGANYENAASLQSFSRIVLLDSKSVKLEVYVFIG